MTNHMSGSSPEERLLRLEKDVFIMRVRMAEAFETINMLVKANEILVNDLSYLYEKLKPKNQVMFAPTKSIDDDTYN